MQTDNRAKRRNGTTGQKIRLILGVTATLLVCLFIYWWHTAMTAPEVAIPMPTMPHPNAYDTFVSAGNQLLDDNKIGFAMSFSSRHNANVPNDHAYTLTEKEKLIAENAPTLKTLREGLNQEYMNPPVRSMYTLTPYYARFRALARLLELDAQVKEAHGDAQGALNSRLDAIHLGVHLPHGSPLIGNLVGIACEAIGRRKIWSQADHLEANQAKAGVQRLEQILSHRMPYADTLQEEKWSMQASLQEILRNPRAALSSINPNGGPQIPNGITNLLFLVYSKRSIMHNNAAYMDELISNARQPYASHPAPPKMPPDPINQIILPVFDQADMYNTDNETQDGLLLVTLALRAYFAEHGSYPQSLSELSPAYLKTLPNDPFALKGTFQYRRQGKGYLLYSLGPDGKDNGGKMIDDIAKAKSTNPNQRYFVQEDSEGDIVAGKNIW